MARRWISIPVSRWVICCGGTFDVEWNGGSADRDVQIVPLGDGPVGAEGHFGSGILTIYPRVMFRTESGYNLLITGPPNDYHFTMNWKVTRPGHRIRFEKGEPYCFLFPIRRGVPEAMEPVLKNLSDAPDSLRGFRTQVKSLRERQGKSIEIDNEKQLVFQKWYMQGQMPDGSDSFEAHQKSILLKPFQDTREGR